MPDLAPPRAGTLYLVHVLTHATRSRIDMLLAPVGLTSFHFTVLSVIARNEGLSSSSLSRRFYVTPQAMGELMVLLEKRGFIKRTENVTNRKILGLSLTSSGRKALAAAETLVQTFEQQVFADLTNEKRALLRETLTNALGRLREQ